MGPSWNGYSYCSLQGVAEVVSQVWKVQFGVLDQTYTYMPS